MLFAEMIITQTTVTHIVFHPYRLFFLLDKRDRLLLFFENELLQALRQLCAVVVDICSPEVCASVHDDEPDGDGDGEAERAGALQPVADDITLLIADLLERLAGDAVQHPDQHGAQERAVDQVDGEAVAAEPHEVLVGQNLLRARREEESDDDDIQAERREATGNVGPFGEEPLAHLHQLAGPGEPLRAVGGVRGEVEAEDDEEGRDHVESEAVVGHESLAARVERKVAEEHGEVELLCERLCFWVSITRQSKSTEGLVSYQQEGGCPGRSSRT